MRSTLQKTRLLQLIEQRNGYLVLACGLMVLCVLLATLIFYLSNRERIVITPPVIDRSFWVTNSQVSPEYLSEMTVFFAYLRLNVTPDTVDSQRQLLLRYVDPRYYGQLNDALIAERDRILQQHISSAFYPVNVQVNSKALAVVITGDLTSSIGTTPLPTQRVTYAVTYRYNNGRLFVSQFQEVHSHDN